MDESISHIEPYNAKDYATAIEPVMGQLASNPAHSSVAEKIAIISREFLEIDYVPGTLGEGPAARFDQNPLFRNDSFDCLTFVNTVLAILHSNDIVDFPTNLLKLNYYDETALYEKRFHFMSTDWNIENVRQGFIKDITADMLNQFDGSEPEVATTLIDKPNWFLKRSAVDIKHLKNLSVGVAENLLAELHGFAKQFKAQEGTVNYIPFKKLFSEDGRANLFLFAKIPPGSIIEIVRPDWPLRNKIGTNLNVSHLGFALYVENQLVLCHASQLQKKVVDEPLINYLREHCLNSETIAGINVHAVL